MLKAKTKVNTNKISKKGKWKKSKWFITKQQQLHTRKGSKEEMRDKDT